MTAVRQKASGALALLLALTLLLTMPLPVGAWGDHGHFISGKAAATNLPSQMPAFFRNATEQLAYLNPEPDRWRVDAFEEMNEGFRYDHYLDIEAVPAWAFDESDRFEFLEALVRSGMTHPEKKAGLLHFHIIELYQRLETEFRLWRAASNDPQRRGWIEQRIINDAGLLGHYVTDGANPHHTTIHFDGWASGVPNPNNFTPTGDRFHTRFETEFVEARVVLDDITPNAASQPQQLNNLRADVMNYIRASNARVTRLYELDKLRRFNSQNDSADHKQFAVERLKAGVVMLRNVWWTAWVRSGQ